MHEQNPQIMYQEAVGIGNGQSININIQKKNDGCLLGDLPPLKGMPSDNSQRFISSAAAMEPNSDLIVGEMPPAVQNSDIIFNPNWESYNYSLVQMDDFLKDQGLFNSDSTELVHKYYNSLSVMNGDKPFFFPPADLGMIESAGSMENSSKYPVSVQTQKLSIKSKDKKSQSNSVRSMKSSKSALSEEHPVSDLKSYQSSQDSISGIKGASERGPLSQNSSFHESLKSSVKSDKSNKNDECKNESPLQGKFIHIHCSYQS